MYSSKAGKGPVRSGLFEVSLELWRSIRLIFESQLAPGGREEGEGCAYKAGWDGQWCGGRPAGVSGLGEGAGGLVELE